MATTTDHLFCRPWLTGNVYKAMLRQKIWVSNHDDDYNDVSHVIQSNCTHDVFHRVDSYHTHHDYYVRV